MDTINNTPTLRSYQAKMNSTDAQVLAWYQER